MIDREDFVILNLSPADAAGFLFGDRGLPLFHDKSSSCLNIKVKIGKFNRTVYFDLTFSVNVVLSYYDSLHDFFSFCDIGGRIMEKTYPELFNGLSDKNKEKVNEYIDSL